MEYVMRISRLTIDKLGIKLYDRVSAALAELVANSYDADAEHVTISAPMGEFLAAKSGKSIADLGFEIVVSDDGHGMTPEEMQRHYLVVGAERRTTRGERSPRFNRPVMGRKGIGKLAPFGICGEIEVISSGGKLVKQGNSEGYLTSHIIMRRDEMMTPEEEDYRPERGELDETLRQKAGTTIRLRKFAHRSVPQMNNFARELAHRFGVHDQRWEVTLNDALDPGRSRSIGLFDIDLMPGTQITFKGPEGDGTFTFPTDNVSDSFTIGHDGEELSEPKPWIELDGTYYPIRGWMAYGKEPHRDELEEGVRIICRGKIAAQTQIFNRGAGFHGELQLRSYLVGELHLDWLDLDYDRIDTGRSDILWSDDLNEKLADWGLSALKILGRLARNPAKQRAWETFQKTAGLEEKLMTSFPREADSEMRSRSREIIKLLAQNMREEELKSRDDVEGIVSLGILFGPLVTVDEELRQAADDPSGTVKTISAILQHAKIAELTAFGKVAENRVRIIERLRALLGDDEELEDVYQDLIENAPWLINPEWAPVTANQTLKTLRSEFEKWLTKHGVEINLTDFGSPQKRPDFVLTTQDNKIQIVEIKSPGHTFDKSDFERLFKYHTEMLAFLYEPGNKHFVERLGRHHITLVCDEVSLPAIEEQAYKKLVDDDYLTHQSWSVFLAKTVQVHQDFLDLAEAERTKVVSLEAHRYTSLPAGRLAEPAS